MKKRKKRLVLASGASIGFPTSCQAIELTAYGGLDIDGLYQRLEVAPTASFAEIKEAALNKMRQSHPDVGGSQEEFCSYQEAAQILLNPLDRRAYDERKNQYIVYAPKTEKTPVQQANSVFTFYKENNIIINIKVVNFWIEKIIATLQNYGLSRQLKLGFRSGAEVEKEGDILTIGIEVEPSEDMLRKIVLLMM